MFSESQFLLCVLYLVEQTDVFDQFSNLSNCYFANMNLDRQQERQIVARYACLTLSCNHPRNFIAIAIIVLEICTGQNSSMKINKGQ